MSKATHAARKVASKVADKLEKLAREIWEEEAHLTAAGENGSDPEAAKLAAAFGLLCVDRLHPAVEALRTAAGPTTRPCEESEDEVAALPKVLAQC